MSTPCSVIDLRVVLHPVEARFVGMAHVGAGSEWVVRAKPRAPAHVVPVAHPGDALLRQAFEELVVQENVRGLGLAVLPGGVPWAW